MKFTRKALTIAAVQVTDLTAGSYGQLGTLTSGDYIVFFEDNTMSTLSAGSMSSFYYQISETASLTGTSQLFP